MEFHEIANVFPLLDETELRDLAKDIVQNGLRHPVVTFEGKILDGRNRYRALQAAGLKIPTIEFGGDWDAAVNLVTSENLHRRHMTASQRAFAANGLATLRRGRPGEKASGDAITTQARVAEQLGVSRSSVQRARKIEEQGVPELAEAAKKDVIGLRTAAALTQLSEDEQREVLAAGPRAAVEAKAREKVAELRPATEQQPKPAPAVESSESQSALQDSRDAMALVNGIVLVVRSLEDAIQQLSTGDMSLNAKQEALLLRAADRIEAGGQWLKTVVRGEGISDMTLVDWLSEGNQL